jgi:hypothetical protein
VTPKPEKGTKPCVTLAKSPRKSPSGLFPKTLKLIPKTQPAPSLCAVAIGCKQTNIETPIMEAIHCRVSPPYKAGDLARSINHSNAQSCSTSARATKISLSQSHAANALAAGSNDPVNGLSAALIRLICLLTMPLSLLHLTTSTYPPIDHWTL